MTKVDRAEFDSLFTEYEKSNYYGALALKQCMDYKMTSKRDALARLRKWKEEQLKWNLPLPNLR